MSTANQEAKLHNVYQDEKCRSMCQTLQNVLSYSDRFCGNKTWFSVRKVGEEWIIGGGEPAPNVEGKAEIKTNLREEFPFLSNQVSEKV